MLTPRPIVKPTTGEISLKRYLNEDELWTIPTIGLEPRDLPCSLMSSMMGTVEPVMEAIYWAQEHQGLLIKSSKEVFCNSRYIVPSTLPEMDCF